MTREGNAKELEMEIVVHKVKAPPAKNVARRIENAVKETMFPDDPFRQFKNQSCGRRLLLALQYVFPILQWAPNYSLPLFKSDLVSGITIATLAIPQSISYAKLANLPPAIGLYSSFVPPMIYTVLGSSKEVAVGTVAVVSLLIPTMLAAEVSPAENPHLYMRLAFTSTFFAGVFQASLGILRLGFLIDFLSHATIVGFMAGAATVVCLQQLKGILGLDHFATRTDIISVVRSALGQADKWRWETVVLGACFLLFLLLARYISKKSPKLFLVAAAAPLASVILCSLLVFFTRAEDHGVSIVGHLKKGLNPPSLSLLDFEREHLKISLKTGLITGIISLTEGICVGRSFSLLRNYHIDGNKEMVAIGIMNVVGSLTSCYITTGAFSRTAVNVNAGCKTAASNMVMASVVMVTLLLLTPLFYYTPMVVLSSIILSAMLGLIDVRAAYRLWKVDKIDFLVCVAAYFGVVFGNVEMGLFLAVSISVGRVLMHVSRPRTAAMGNVSGTSEYRDREQYPEATKVPGILVLQIDAPICFTNSTYLRERVMRWIEEEEEAEDGDRILHYVVLDITPVAAIDTTGINMLRELTKTLDCRGLRLVLANPGPEVMEKLQKARFVDEIMEQKWVFLTVAEAVTVCAALVEGRKANIITAKGLGRNAIVPTSTINDTAERQFN